MAEILTFHKGMYTWTARVGQKGVTIKRSSVGLEGRPYTVQETIEWAQWERLTAWVAYERADQQARR